MNEESPDYVLRQDGLLAAGDRRPGRSGRSASSSRSTSRTASTTRSTAWAGTTTRTPSRSRDSRSSSCSRATTRSRAALSTRAVRRRRRPPSRTRQRPCPVAAVLVHREEHERAAGRQGRPVGVRLRHARREELLRRASRVGHRRHGPLHQGPEGHRHRPQADGTERQGCRSRLPAAAHERQLADATSRSRRPRRESTARSGCSSTGATSTTCSSSSASRTSPTTSGPGMENVVYIVDSGRGRSGDRVARHAELQVDQRPRLEDGARQEGSDGGHLADRLRRG